MRERTAGPPTHPAIFAGCSEEKYTIVSVTSSAATRSIEPKLTARKCFDHVLPCFILGVLTLQFMMKNILLEHPFLCLRMHFGIQIAHVEILICSTPKMR